MSKNWPEDIRKMHEKFGALDWVANQEKGHPNLAKLLKFRLKFLEEELLETFKGADGGDPEEIVDGLIDLCVVAIGTLDLYGVDAHKAWDSVLEANMAKKPGVKPSRPNPLGLPDLIKPEGWQGPNHSDNHGILNQAIT